MCFYSKLSKKAVELEQRFKARLDHPEQYLPQEQINGFSFPRTPVLCDRSREHIIMAAWGLVPHWARDRSIQKHTLNARIETLHEKPAFRDAAGKRCLVIADGFYEWQWLDTAGKKKQKYLLELPGSSLFAFAGIYAEWTDPETGEWIPGYSIVTTQATGLLKEIHNSKERMPVVLRPEQEENWLDGAAALLFRENEAGLLARKV